MALCRYCIKMKTSSGKGSKCTCAKPLVKNCKRPKCKLSSDVVKDRVPCTCRNADHGPASIIHCHHSHIH